jgi:excisionase family DNA binding protein
MMRSKFEWQKRVDVSATSLHEFLECRLPLSNADGEVFTALVARIEREKLDGEQAEESGTDELFHPALYLEVRHSYQVRVAGCIPLARANLEEMPWFSRALREQDIEFFKGVQKVLAPDPEGKDRGERRKAAQKKYFELDGEYSFEDAEDVVQGFIKEVVSGLRGDAFKFQETFGGDILSVTEVAELFGVPRNTVLNWIKGGGLKGFRLGSKWMIERKDLAAAMEQAKGHSRS